VTVALTYIVAFVLGMAAGFVCLLCGIGYGIKTAYEACHNVTGTKGKDLSKAENDLLDEIDSDLPIERKTDNVS